MVKYALNTQKGTTIVNDDVGKIPALVAIPINEEKAKIAKYLRGVVVFDRVAGIKPNENYKNLYGIEEKDLKTIPMKTYQDFVKEYRDVKIASKKYKEYQNKMKEKKQNGSKQ